MRVGFAHFQDGFPVFHPASPKKLRVPRSAGLKTACLKMNVENLLERVKNTYYESLVSAWEETYCEPSDWVLRWALAHPDFRRNKQFRIMVWMTNTQLSRRLSHGDEMYEVLFGSKPPSKHSAIKLMEILLPYNSGDD